MFIKRFEKIAGWNGGGAKPFPKGIMDRAIQSYNQKILNKGTDLTKKVVQEKPAEKIRMVHIEEKLLHKLLDRKGGK